MIRYEEQEKAFYLDNGRITYCFGIVKGQLQALIGGIAGAIVGGALLWLVGGFNPAIGAMRSVVNCVIAGIPALIAVVVAGTVLGNPTAVELVDSGKRALRRLTGRR